MMLPLTRLWPLLRLGVSSAGAGRLRRCPSRRRRKRRPEFPRRERPWWEAGGARRRRGGGGRGEGLGEGGREEGTGKRGGGVGTRGGEEEEEYLDPVPPLPEAARVPGPGVAPVGGGAAGAAAAAAREGGASRCAEPGGGGGGGGGSGGSCRLCLRARSAPWCVDSSPSCCLMESRRPRHRKCLYCPPHSLPVAG
ncbi:uncharacterized protein LOC110205439 [Phascolarctos cinereus]